MSLNVEDIEFSDPEPRSPPVYEPAIDDTQKVTIPSNEVFKEWEQHGYDGEDKERPGFLLYEEHSVSESKWMTACTSNLI